MSAIELSDVWLSYRPRGDRGQRHAPTWALRNVELAVAAGECVGVLGANGSGKSSLLRVVSGIFMPTRGTARIAAETGLVLDVTVGLNRDLSGHQALEVYAAVDGISGARWRALRPRATEITELSDRVLRNAVSSYSLGMLLRLQFALAIAEQRPALVIDEVLAAADGAYRTSATFLIREQIANGTAVVMASHDTSLIRALAQRVVLLVDGEVAFDGAVAEGLRKYKQLQGRRHVHAV